MIRWIFGLVFLCAVAVPPVRADEMPSFEELMKLEGHEFVKVASQADWKWSGRKCPYTVDQLISIAEKLIVGVRSMLSERSDDVAMNPFGPYFGEACERANDRQLEKLVSLYARLEPESFEKSAVLPIVASRVLAQQVATLPPRHLELSPDEDAIVLPERLQKAPEELQRAWRAFHRAKAPFENAFPKSAEQIEVSANMTSFYNLISQSLSGATGLENEVRRFAWTGANCMNITDVEDAQDIALLLMMIREGRLDEAVGAALRVTGTEGSTSAPDASTKPVIDLLKQCGLDWEEIFAGGQLESQERGWDYVNKAPYLAALAKYGSARAGSFIRQLAYFAAPDSRAKYVAVFGAWIESAPKRAKCEGQELDLGRRESFGRVAKPMSQPLQDALLSATEEFATAEAPENLAMYAINIFCRTQARSSIPALRALTRHGSNEVTTAAERILCAMGEGTATSRNGPPVQFQILINDKPVKPGVKVRWNIATAKGSSISGDTDTQADGVLSLPHQHFVNVNHPATAVALFAPQEEAFVPLFDTNISPPWNLDGVTKVEVRTSPLEIMLRNRDGLNAPRSENAYVHIYPHLENHEPGVPAVVVDTSYESSRGLYDEENKISVNPSIVFPAVQEGRYDVYVGVPGAETWHAIVTVDSKTQKIEAMLKPASDLRFEIVTPDGRRFRWAELVKDGKPFGIYEDMETHTYRALPCGSYVLRIRGSSDFDTRQDGRKLTRGPDEVPYKGQDVAFKIEKGSPGLIDLGEIHLAPETAK